MQRGDNLTISTELVDVRDNKQLWGEQYSEKVSDLLSVQREIATKITSNLRLKLSGPEQSRVAKHYTDNSEAYQLYLKGRFYWNKRTDEGLRKSIEYFNQAIEKDPNYALAYAGIADSYGVLFFYSAVRIPAKEAFPKAKAAALKALAIDDTLAEAHNGLAYALFEYDWDFAGAEKEFRRAIELNPNYATAHQWYGEYLTAVGRDAEGIAEAKRGQELDPLSVIINSSVGLGYLKTRRYDEAIKQLRATIAMDPNFGPAHEFLLFACEASGRYDEAIAERQSTVTIYGRESQDLALRRGAALREAYAREGARGYWRKRLEQVMEDAKASPIDSFDPAAIYANLGEKEKSLEWLQKAYEERNEGLLHLNETAAFDNLRSDPRFADLVRRVGLPQ